MQALKQHHSYIFKVNSLLKTKLANKVS